MILKVYQPESPVLKRYIECFYILEKTAAEKPITYFTFPSIYSIVTISAETSTFVSPDKIITTYCPTSPIETNLVCDFNQPVLISYDGKINEITTYFKPLGLSAFIVHDLQHYNSGTFPDFNPHADYKEAMTAILAIADHQERIRALEAYWISKLRPFEDPLLENVLREMLDTNNLNQSMTTLSRKIGRSRTTINKHFDQHICKSPSQFKKIVRFRAAIQSQLDDKNNISRSYHVDYFDQSHMIRDFKKLTGFTPKVFFSKIAALERDEIKWIFI
ncbi:AraC-like DNA-binding protein [Sphingobacterium detergens]|uniref:AraC-like DNA-binding protein n=2 Tax=Sphingobacterium detergens TaxID=1145106 RepID=A0A420BFE3_SPHD1|nr:AraC-like DNA-binding protein [Sphingobacterium detergens]